MLLAVVILALFLGAAWVLRYFYKLVFWVKRSATMVACRVPKGEQYAAVKDQIVQTIQTAEALPFEPVTIRSYDGLLLFGRYYETKPGAPVQILIHGFRSNPLRDCSAALLFAREMGHNVLLVTQRCHEKSEGWILTFGIKERRDCLSWAEYAAERFGQKAPIFLSGVSMGASTVLMASELKLPAGVKGIIADCPYDSAKNVIIKAAEDANLPAETYYLLTRLTLMLLGWTDLNSASAVEAVRNTRIPILLIHGEDDRFVPCEMSQKIYDACASRKRLVILPGVGHILANYVGREQYRREVARFIEECLA